MAEGLRLFLLRHGLADRDQYHGDDDDLRPLTMEGRRRMGLEADFIVGLAPGIDAVITSPLVRAVETAEIVASRLGLAGTVTTDRRLGFGFDLPELVAMLAGLAADRRRIMIVGHEPSFSRVIGDLVGGARVVMKKGALARVDLVPGDEVRGRLMWLLQPRVLVGGGGGRSG